MLLFIRTCQECGHRINTKPPGDKLTSAYQNKLCPKCKSSAFDYGSNQNVNPATLKRLHDEK